MAISMLASPIMTVSPPTSALVVADGRSPRCERSCVLPLVDVLHLIERPAADRVVTRGEEVGDMGVQALHADPRTADTTERAWPDVVVGDRR